MQTVFSQGGNALLASKQHVFGEGLLKEAELELEHIWLFPSWKLED